MLVINFYSILSSLLRKSVLILLRNDTRNRLELRENNNCNY